MKIADINWITAAMVLIIIIAFIKGMTRDFSERAIYKSVSRGLFNLLFLLSLILSIYLTGKILFNPGEGIPFRTIHDMIPDGALSSLNDQGILAYLIVTPAFLLVICIVLHYIMLPVNPLIQRSSAFISRCIKKTGSLMCRILGIIMEIAKGMAVIILLVMAVSLVNSYYPATALMDISSGSRAYSYVNNQVVQPIMGTALGRKIPAFLWRSVDEVSKSIDQSKVFKDKGIIQSMGYLRFQFETKSDDRIDAAAKDIVGSETDERKKAYLLYRWVGKNIKYDWNKYNDINAGTAGNDKFGAVNTFNTGKGVCEDYSDLYTAMARAAGLKVRIIVGQGFNGINWEGHAWNEVYINSENRWIPLDTTWAGSGNYFDSKGFYETHIFEGVAGEW